MTRSDWKGALSLALVGIAFAGQLVDDADTVHQPRRDWIGLIIFGGAAVYLFFN